MSGHSKWATIKHAKGIADAKRGQLFTKLTREIIVAVRQGGSNPETNFRLRLAVQKARDSSMPSDNIERAIKKGAGETEGTSLVEMVLEGYGPSGAAILVQAVSDNRNRTVQDVRNIFSRNGGNLSESGSVAWIFEQKGLIRIPLNNQNSEELELQAIDAGAEDVKVEDSELEIYTKLEDMERIRRALQEKNIPIDSSELVMNSKNMVDLDERASLQTLRLLERLEELDEVQHVHTNADFPAEILEKYKAQVH